jgi:hypothetical protein
MPSVRGVASLTVLTAACLVIAPQVVAQAAGQFVEMNCVPVGAPLPAPAQLGPGQYGPGVEIINGSSHETKSFNAQQASSAHLERTKADSSGGGVEVINGETHRTVFWNSQLGDAASADSAVHSKVVKHVSGKNGASASGPIAQIEILNGTQHETLVFDAMPNPFDGSDAILRTAKPVVLGVTSSGSKTVSGAVEPVVVGIAPFGSQPEGGLQQEEENVQPADGLVFPDTEAAPPPESMNNGDKTQPVVVGIASAGNTNAEGETRTVAVDVAPKAPRRPPYRRPTPEP